MEQTRQLEELVLASEIRKYGAPRKDALAGADQKRQVPAPD